MLVVVLVVENPDRFAIRLTEQISCRTSVSLRSPESQCTEDEHDDDDSKFRNLGLICEICGYFEDRTQSALRLIRGAPNAATNLRLGALAVRTDW